MLLLDDGTTIDLTKVGVAQFSQGNKMSIVGLQLGRYRLIRMIGSGGMGEVYLAEDTNIDRQVAIKLFRNEGARYSGIEGAKRAARLFRREMKAIAMLDHPHILPLYDYGEDSVNGLLLIYM